jgi:hypothetical protein
MRCSSLARLPLVIALAAVATLGSLAASPPASAAVARVTCSSVVGIGDAKDPAIVSGCTNRAKTAGTGKLVDREPRNDNASIWTITWSGKHGTTIVRITTAKLDKKHTCPKGWVAFVESGKVTGGSGPAHVVIPNGQTVSAHFCGNGRTSEVRLWKGTKLVL